MITKFGQYLNENVSSKLNETIVNPNFSIVVPGGCNAKCDFCFWKQSKVCENYIGNLTETLNNMPSQFYQLSLTGGEPSLSPYLDKILENIDRNRWKNTVLTSNGTNLSKFIPKLQGAIDHVNISRHHYDDKINESVFNTDSVPSSEKLKSLVKELNKVGIDVTYSAVITEHLNSKEEVEKFIKYARSHGVKQVFLRKEHGTLEPSEAEKAFEHLPADTHTCPVCRNTTQKINGTTVVWKASLEEPSQSLGMIYEAIYHEDGTLTSDWEQKFKVEPQLIKENKTEVWKNTKILESCGSGGFEYGCGYEPGEINFDKEDSYEKDEEGYHFGCGGSLYTKYGTLASREEEELYNKRMQKKKAVRSRAKKITKLKDEIEKKEPKSRDNFYGGGYISTFENFNGQVLENCGGGFFGGGCGSTSSKKEKTPEEIAEIARKKILKGRKNKIDKIENKIKEKTVKTPKNKDNFYGGGYTSSTT